MIPMLSAVAPMASVWGNICTDDECSGAFERHGAKPAKLVGYWVRALIVTSSLETRSTLVVSVRAPVAWVISTRNRWSPLANLTSARMAGGAVELTSYRH